MQALSIHTDNSDGVIDLRVHGSALVGWVWQEDASTYYGRYTGSYGQFDFCGTFDNEVDAVLFVAGKYRVMRDITA